MKEQAPCKVKARDRNREFNGMGNGEQTGVKCVALWVPATLRFSKAPEAGFQRILIFKEPALGSRVEDDIAMERHY